MPWTLHYVRSAVDAMHHKVAREHVRSVIGSIEELAENPFPANAQADDEDPSALWIPIPGDYIVTYEIVDEKHIVRILSIE